jgi:hypothetical protein
MPGSRLAQAVMVVLAVVIVLGLVLSAIAVPQAY